MANNKFFSSIFNFIKKIPLYLTQDIWNTTLSELPRWKALFIKFIRLIALTFKRFRENQVQVKASALTYFSVLSIVPIAAMAFGIAKGFGYELVLEKQIRAQLQAQQDVIDKVLEFANKLLNSTHSGFITGVGLVALIWAVMKVLGNIEESFNGIWDVKKARGWARKFSDYLSIMLIAPILVILSSSVAIYISTSFKSITASIKILGYIAPLVSLLIQLIPFILIWFAFAFTYIIMPNTKVHASAGIIAGIIAGTIFQIVQGLYIELQIGVSKYSAIYGGFAALPLFLIWLQTSWMIVLFGAELSYSIQNLNKYEFETDIKNLSFYNQKILSLLIAKLVFKNFEEGKVAISASRISEELKIPTRITENIIANLVGSHILVELSLEHGKEVRFQPALDIHKISIQYLFEKLEAKGSTSYNIFKIPESDRVAVLLNKHRNLIHNSDINHLVKDI